MKPVPVPKLLPPLAAAYQLGVVPADTVAPNVTVPTPQRLAGVVVKTEGLTILTETIFE